MYFIIFLNTVQLPAYPTIWLFLPHVNFHWGYQSWERGLTTEAMLHISALVSHLVPSMTLGQQYCHIWMLSGKWCSAQVARK